MTEPTLKMSYESLLNELRRVKNEYVDEQLRWYTRRIPIVRFVFRVSGVLLILASLSIPYLSVLDGPLKTTGVPLAAFSVAFLAGVNSFFAWQPAWHKYVAVKLNVEHLVAVWELEMVNAAAREPSEDGARIAMDATRTLLDGVAMLTTTEASNLFQIMRFPQVEKALVQERTVPPA